MNEPSAIARLLPVLLLIGAGQLLRRTGVLSGEGVAGLRSLIVKVTLPCVLFLAFSSVVIELRHAALVALVFAACGVALLAGGALRRALGLAPAFPFLLTGFEAGMLGYALFTALHGPGAVHRFALVDLGQVLFVFFVLVPGLERASTGTAPRFRETLRGFARTPVIVSILSGLAVQALGLRDVASRHVGTAALLDALALLGGLTTPLVALAVGHDLRLHPRGLARPLLTVAARLALWAPLGGLLIVLLRRVLRLEVGYEQALLVLLLLPPPFVIPIFLGRGEAREREEVADTLALATVFTLVALPTVAAFAGR